MTLKDLLLNHLIYTFEKEAWQPSLSEAVDGLTARQAAWTPSAERHSIWQIVRHVVLWKQALIDAMDGRVADYNAVEALDWKEAGGDDAAWQEDVRRLHDVSLEVKRRIEALEDGGAGATVPTFAGFRERPLPMRVMHAATHDAYHAGQIRYIRALQGV